MRISKTIRKVAAIGAGATMLGATMFGAMAADLASYPKPFVQDGKYNALIVFGDTAKTSDVIGAVDIATNLAFEMKQTAAATGTATTTVDNGAAVENSGQKLYKLTALTTIKDTFTKTELPSILAAQTVTDTDGTSFDVTSSVKTIAGASVDFGKTTDSIDDPIVFLKMDDSSYNYTAEITFSPAVNTSRLQNKKINLFGKEYTFSANVAELGLDGDSGLVLYGGGVQKIMTAGDTATVDVEGGKQAVISVVGVNTDASTAMITVNSESKQMSAGQTETLGGVRIYLKQIFSYTVPAKQGAAEVFIGSDKIVLKTNNAVRRGSSDVDGTKAIITATATGGKVSKIAIQVVPYQASSRVKYFKKGDSYVDPVFGSFKWVFSGATPDLDDASRDVIKIYPSAEDRIQLEFKNANGQQYNTVILKGVASSGASDMQINDGSYPILTTSGPWMAENDKFIITANQYSHIYQVKQILNTSSTPKIKLQDAASGSNSEELSLTTSGTQTTTWSLDGYTYTITLNNSATGINITTGTGSLTNQIYTQNGALIGLPMTTIESGNLRNTTVLTRTNSTIINITEETGYNGGTFKVSASSGQNLGNGTIALNITQQSNSNYDAQVHFVTMVNSVGTVGAAPSGVDVALATVGTSYDQKAVTNYGTYIKYNTNSFIAQLYYPKDATSYQLFLAPTLATVKTTGTAGTSVTINEIAVGAAKLSSDALAADPDLSMNNYILVGGPCVNAAAVKIMGVTADTDCAAGFEAGKAKVKLYENAATGKVALLVAGYSAEDTTRAARAVKTGKLATVAAAAKEVSVTTVTDTPTLTVVTQ